MNLKNTNKMIVKGLFGYFLKTNTSIFALLDFNGYTFYI